LWFYKIFLMKNLLVVTVCLLLVTRPFSQTISQRIEKAYRQFEADSQLRHAISSLYVINAKTGEVVFDKNSQVGLAPASTQKIITAATAFELLGKGYQYKTEVGYDGIVNNHELNGNLYVLGSGDPTFGSWRWQSTGMQQILQELREGIKKTGVGNIAGRIIYESGKWETMEIPDGWIWEDLGNYYGAGALGLNWHENQYDLLLKSGRNIGDSVKAIGTFPEISNIIVSEVKSAARGTGDNAYIYLPSGDYFGAITVRGTIPVNEESFKISGAMPSADLKFFNALFKEIDTAGISIYSGTYAGHEVKRVRHFVRSPKSHPILTHLSPTLDSIIYWFLQKSINLYGEALIKTFAYEKKGFGSTDSGVVIVKDFWKQKGLDEEELNIMDGSGLSPQNRVTTHAQAGILKYARTKDWFPYFYEALPIYNGMKMKSGSIRDVKGYCGYQKSSDGNEYIFSFLVNNYNGSSSAVVNKMYRVLDELK